jgi:assimilatory nitrate reductase catalytic subunit
VALAAADGALLEAGLAGVLAPRLAASQRGFLVVSHQLGSACQCPKGVKRYLQQQHPDRLLCAYQKDAAAPSGFRKLAYEDAVRRVAEAIERIQAEHGRDAFALLSGASLTTEKTYLMGKFAHMCLRTANIDYNGRLCMVSAAAGNKKAFGIDRAANP